MRGGLDGSESCSGEHLRLHGGMEYARWACSISTSLLTMCSKREMGQILLSELAES